MTIRLTIAVGLFVLMHPMSEATAQVAKAISPAEQDPKPTPNTDAKKSAPPTAKPKRYVSGPNVSGIATNPSGAPAADASVYLRQSPKGSITLPTNPLKTRSDERGRFQFEGVEPGPYRLWAETDKLTSLTKKLAGISVTVRQKAPPASDEIPVSLRPGCGYDVVIVAAETGNPISDAKISFGWTDIVREYESASDGLVKIRNLSIDGWYFVVRAKGFATEFKKTSPQKLGTVLPMRFELQPGGTITGTLRDDSGTALPNAKVTVSSAEMSMAPRYGNTQTDSQGGYTISGLPIGLPLRLSGTKEGYNRASQTCAVASASTPTRGDLVCKKRPYGGDVVVTVVAQDGSPIAGATIANRGNSSADTREVVTDALGNAKIQDLSSGYAGCNITVKADAFVSQHLSVTPGTIEFPTEIKVQLKLGKTVSGVVLRPDGTPAPKLRVYFNGGHTTNPLGGRVDTDQQGRFTLKGLPEKSTVTVYTPKEFAPISRLPVPIDSEDEFRIQMTTAGVIRIRAIDADTETAIDEFNVKLGFCEDRRPNDPRPRGISSSLINPGINIQGTKKEYRLDGQMVGTPYKIIVSADGYESKTIARVEAEAIDKGELIDVGLQKLRPEDFQTVAGRLLDAEGKPIVGAQVRLLLGSAIPNEIDPFTQEKRDGGWRFYHWDLLSRDDIENRDKCAQLLKTVSDPKGKFTFTGVKKGTPWMELFYFGNNIMSQRYSNLRSRDEDELTQLTLKAEKPSRLSITVNFSKYPSAHSASLSAENYTNGPNAVKLAYGHTSQNLPGDGTGVVFENLPAGKYSVQLSEKPIAMEGGRSFRTTGITSRKIVIENDRQLKVSF